MRARFMHRRRGLYRSRNGLLFGVAVIGDNQFEIQFGAGQDKCEGPGIVYVSADVGIEDDRNGVCFCGTMALWLKAGTS